MPYVSVVMPMYNAKPYVGEAIESILQQTLQDWELLVIDDASTDGSPEVVREYAARDKRIRLIRNDSDLHGEGPARNIGIENATGEYVAMMDADDISLPRRLEFQTAFMDKHPDVTLSGCWAKCFGDRRRIWWSFPSARLVKALLFFSLECWGPTIIFRRSAIASRYRKLLIGTDTYFCISTALQQRVANVPRILYRYRVHPKSITHTVDVYPYKKQIYSELMPLRLGFTPTPEQVDAHFAWLGFQNGITLTPQLRWIAYVITHGKYTWDERLILVCWCSVYAVKSVFRHYNKSK